MGRPDAICSVLVQYTFLDVVLCGQAAYVKTILLGSRLLEVDSGDGADSSLSHGDQLYIAMNSK